MFSWSKDGIDDMRRLASHLAEADSVLLLTHDRPDGDAVGACLGLASILERDGKSVTVVMPDGVPYRYECLEGTDRVMQEVPTGARFDVTVVLDTGSLDRIGGGLPTRDVSGKVLNLDHHATNDGFAEVTWCRPEASSAGEMVLALALQGLDSEPDRGAANALFCAIMTDTGSFRYSNTSASALEAASYLVDKGARPADLSNEIYYSHPAGRMMLAAKVLSTLELTCNGQVAMVRLTRTMLKEVGGEMSWADEFIEFPRSIRGVEVALLFKETSEEREIKVSLRSKTRLDVAAIAERFCGGGHPHAAGLTLSGVDMDEAVKVIVDEVENML